MDGSLVVLLRSTVRVVSSVVLAIVLAVLKVEKGLSSVVVLFIVVVVVPVVESTAGCFVVDC